jgi:hypothetical protein
MAKALLKLDGPPSLFYKIAQASKSGDQDSISISDLDAYSEKASNELRIREESRPLLGVDRLMSRLDEKNGEYDGYVNTEDLKNFVAKNSNSTQGISVGVTASAFRQPAVEFVKDILAGKHPDLLRDGALDVPTIMKRAGLKPTLVQRLSDYASIASQFSTRPSLGFGSLLPGQKLNPGLIEISPSGNTRQFRSEGR